MFVFRSNKTLYYQGEHYFFCRKSRTHSNVSTSNEQFQCVVCHVFSIHSYFSFVFFSNFLTRYNNNNKKFLYFSVNVAKKRKIYDTRGMNKSSYHSHSYGHHNHHNHDYPSASAHRRGNRYTGFTFRGLFEPTPFYKIFGIINKCNNQRFFFECFSLSHNLCVYFSFHASLKIKRYHGFF